MTEALNLRTAEVQPTTSASYRVSAKHSDFMIEINYTYSTKALGKLISFENEALKHVLEVIKFNLPFKSQASVSSQTLWMKLNEFRK